MYVMLGSLPVWASREVIQLHLPEAFKGRFENARCIIDCTEIKCEKPQIFRNKVNFIQSIKRTILIRGWLVYLLMFGLHL